ncbi:MAG TPA: SCO family protein [Blastocatellia bacterium]|nr:SCO family protein [Blastocatellia bacterium]
MQKAKLRKSRLIDPSRGRSCRSFIGSCLFVTAFCLLPSAFCFAQPGVPQPNSPLYGGGGNSGQSSTGLPPVLKKVGIDQHLNEQLPLDAVFKDEQGRDVRLGQFFNGKPVVLSLVYYQCPMLCNQVMNGMLGSFRQISFNVGEQFEAVTVSFDPNETPVLAAAKKQTYVAGYNRANGAAGWHFLTGDAANIKRLADAVGFRYTWDEQTKQFAHASGIMIATPEGKLARYFYGIDYPPKDLRLSLVEASANKIATPVDALMLYCYHYDPSTGKYGVVIMNVMRVAGVITIILIVGLLFLLRKIGRRRARMIVSEARP